MMINDVLFNQFFQMYKFPSEIFRFITTFFSFNLFCIAYAFKTSRLMTMLSYQPFVFVWTKSIHKIIQNDLNNLNKSENYKNEQVFFSLCHFIFFFSLRKHRMDLFYFELKLTFNFDDSPPINEGGRENQSCLLQQSLRTRGLNTGELGQRSTCVITEADMNLIYNNYQIDINAQINNQQIINPIPIYLKIQFKLQKKRTLQENNIISINILLLQKIEIENMKLSMEENQSHHQNNHWLKQFYKKAENTISNPGTTNDFQVGGNKVPLFMLSEIQINHYNLIEISAFELNKQVTLKFFDFSDHQKAIILLKARNIMDELQKLCCSIKISFVFNIFLKVMTCLSTLITNNSLKVYRKQKSHQQKKQGYKQCKNQLKKDIKQVKQVERNSQVEIIQQKARNMRKKLRGINLYKQNYLRHIQSISLINLKQNTDQSKGKKNFWSQLQKNLQQISNNLPNLNNMSQQSTTISNWRLQIGNQDTQLININNAMEIVSQIYQNQKLLTLDSMKKVIFKVMKLYEQKIIQLQGVIKNQKQKYSILLSQSLRKRNQNTRDASVQIYQFKLKPTNNKQLSQLKQKLNIADQTIMNMQQVIARLNNQLIESQKICLLNKIKLQQKETKYESLQKNTCQLLKQIQKQKKLNLNKAIDQKEIIIQCQSVLSGKKIEQQSDKQFHEIHENHSLGKKMQKTLYERSRSRKNISDKKINAKSEKIITNKQLISLKIDHVKQQIHVERSNTSFKKKKTIKFNLSQKKNDTSIKENSFSNKKSMSMHSSNKNISLKNFLNIQYDEIKNQLDIPIPLEDKTIQNGFKENLSIQKVFDQDSKEIKQSSKKQISLKFHQVLKEKNIISKQKKSQNSLNTQKKYDNYYILSNHGDIINNQTQSKDKKIQQIIKQEIKKIKFRQSQNNVSYQGRNEKRVQKIPLGNLRSNLKNNTISIMMNILQKQKQQYQSKSTLENLNNIQQQKPQKENRKLRLQKKLKRISNIHAIKQNQNYKEEQKDSVQYKNTSYNTETGKQAKTNQKLTKSYASPLKRTIKWNQKALIERQKKKYQNRNLFMPKVLNFTMNSSEQLNQFQ